jgi:membrane associated rhomboid family serine protease
VSADAPRNTDDYCYRHPDRRSYVLCQRCLRTICPECQTQAAVGVICPECMKEQRQATPPRVRRAQASVRALDSRPIVTFWILGVTAIVSLIAVVPGVPIANYLAFNSVFIDPSTGAPLQPWRVLTTALVHNGFLHLGLNMLAVWWIGRSLEPLLGHVRYLILYVLSAVGGSVAMTLIAPGTTVVGASGAVFGLLGALLVIGRHIGANVRGILIIVGINLVIGLLPIPGFYVAWQAHLGGLAVGALVGLIFARTRRLEQRTPQNLLLGAVAAVLIALCAIPVLI